MKLFLELNQDQILGILEVYTSDNSVILKLKSSAQNFTHNKDQIFQTSTRDKTDSSTFITKDLFFTVLS